MRRSKRFSEIRKEECRDFVKLELILLLYNGKKEGVILMSETFKSEGKRKLKRREVEGIIGRDRGNKIGISAKLNKDLRDFEVTEEDRILERGIIKRWKRRIKIRIRGRLK